MRMHAVVVVITSVVAAGRMAHAADDVVVTAVTAPATAPGQQISLDQQMQGMLAGLGANEERWREQVHAKAMLLVSAVDAACGLTDAQRKKLEIAARVDSGPAWDEVEVIRSRYAGRTIDLQKQENHAEWNRFHQDMSRLQGMLAGGESDPPLLRATIGTILGEDQRSRWERQSAERERLQWLAVVDEAMASFDVQFGLTTRQHDALHGLLVEQGVRIDPRKAWQHGPQWLAMICGHVLGRVDEGRLKAIVSERQWPILAAVIQQSRGMGDHLKQQKIILD